MQRFTRALAEADREINACEATNADIAETLSAALKAARALSGGLPGCVTRGQAADQPGILQEAVHREDGEVERRELTEPFAALLDGQGPATVAAPADEMAQTDGDETDRRRPGNVFRTTFGEVRAGLGGQNNGQNKTTSGEIISFGRGLNAQVLVGAVEALSSTTNRTRRLFRTMQALPEELSTTPRTTRSYRTARPLQPDEIDKLVEARQAGATIREMARQFDICRTTVFKRLHARGLRTRSIAPELLAEATSLYEEGWSTARLSKRLGVPTETLRTGLKVSGVKMRKPGRPSRRQGKPQAVSTRSSSASKSLSV
jgi:hypothetical protein